MNEETWTISIAILLIVALVIIIAFREVRQRKKWVTMREQWAKESNR